MAIREHPPLGTLLLCDFGSGFKPPEMVKRRLVVVISPRIKARPGLCTVVALSTTLPKPVWPTTLSSTSAPACLIGWKATASGSRATWWPRSDCSA